MNLSMFNFNKKKKVLSRYEDPTGEFTEREFEMANWWLKHKAGLRHLLIWILSLWSIITIGIGFWVWGDYLFFGYHADEQMADQIVETVTNYSAMHSHYGAAPISFHDSRVFYTGTHKYDFVTNVTNPNKRWIAHVKFHYTFAGGQTAIAEDMLLPGDVRPIAVLGYAGTGHPSSVKFVVDNIRWEHISAHTISNVALFVKSRLQFQVKNVHFAAIGKNGVPTNQISFSITNASVYGYWSVSFFVGLMNGTSRVAVLPLTITQFKNGETRHIDLRSLSPNLSVNTVIVYPIVNIFDPTVFMTPSV